jgi:hypothetical protein
MLNTVHIEEASYEGNDRVLKEWWCQLDINTPEKQKKMGEDDLIVWAGDQLTVSHIRGLHRFHAEDLNSYDRLAFLKEIPGWFHAQIALEHSLHSQYYGTQPGFGLVHAFNLLKRKGLHAPSVQGTFHHHLKEALLHIAEARFRDIWLVVGKVNKLEDLCDALHMNSMHLQHLLLMAMPLLQLFDIWSPKSQGKMNYSVSRLRWHEICSITSI